MFMHEKINHKSVNVIANDKRDEQKAFDEMKPTN